MAIPYYEILLDNDDPVNPNLRVETVLCTSDWKNGVIQPIVDKEINTSGSFSFTILPGAEHYNEIHRWKSVITVNVCGQNVFHGRVTEVITDFYKQKTVTCEGALGWFNDAAIYLPPSYTYSWELFYISLYRMRHDNAVEPYKRFYMGYGEPESDGPDLLANATYIDGYIDDNGTYHNTSSWRMTDDFIPITIGKRYVVNMPYIEDNPPSARDQTAFDPSAQPPYLYLALYRADKTFAARVDFSTKKQFVADFSIYTGASIKYVKLMCSSQSDTSGVGYDMWMSDNPEFDEIVNEDKTPTNLFEYYSTSILDARGMMIRSRYKNGYNFLDVLNPNRGRNPRKFEFSKNIMELNEESVSVPNPYSVLMAYFDDVRTVYEYTVDIPSAIDIFGRIVKPINMGQNPPATQEDREKMENKMRDYAKFYNPIVTNPLTVRGLDGAVFFNDGEDIIDVGDPVLVTSAPHDINRVNPCLKLHLDLDSPQNNSYTIGPYIRDGEDARMKTLSESFAKLKRKKK